MSSGSKGISGVWKARTVMKGVETRAFQFGPKKFRFDSIRQSDKFAACALIFK